MVKTVNSPMQIHRQLKWIRDSDILVKRTTVDPRNIVFCYMVTRGSHSVDDESCLSPWGRRRHPVFHGIVLPTDTIYRQT